jgi:hypothetical protein
MEKEGSRTFVTKNDSPSSRISAGVQSWAAEPGIELGVGCPSAGVSQFFLPCVEIGKIGGETPALRKACVSLCLHGLHFTDQDWMKKEVLAVATRSGAGSHA